MKVMDVAVAAGAVELAGRRVIDIKRLPNVPECYLVRTEDRLHWEVTPRDNGDPEIVLVLTREQRVPDAA